jgi:hypothetical protein
MRKGKTERDKKYNSLEGGLNFISNFILMFLPMLLIVGDFYVSWLDKISSDERMAK